LTVNRAKAEVREGEKRRRGEEEKVKSSKERERA